MKTPLRSLVLALTATFTLAAVAGPFGLRAGMTIDELRKQGRLVQDGPDIYRTSKLLGGYREFELYSLFVIPGIGLCQVIAVTSPIRSDAYGREVRQAFDRIHALLTQRYSEGSVYDGLRTGAEEVEPQAWMRSMARGERELAAVWTVRDDKLPDRLGGIILRAMALDDERGMLSLRYDFDNYEACAKRRQSRDGARF